MVDLVFFDNYLARDTCRDGHSGQLARFELIAYLSHSDKLHTLLRLQILDQTLVHQHDVGLPADLRMTADAEHEGVVLSVEKVKLILPLDLHVSWVDKAVCSRAPCVVHWG